MFRFPTDGLSVSFRRRLRGALGLMLATGALIACSPTYDWRTVMNDDSGYTVDLPARPSDDERPVEIGGQSLRMHMQTAEADDVVFAVGTVELPHDDPQWQRKALDFLRTGLARNLGVPPQASEVEVPLAAGGSVAGTDMILSAKVGPKQEARWLRVRLVARGTRVYQAAVIAAHAPPSDQVDQFFQSFQLF